MLAAILIAENTYPDIPRLYQPNATCGLVFAFDPISVSNQLAHLAELLYGPTAFHQPSTFMMSERSAAFSLSSFAISAAICFGVR